MWQLQSRLLHPQTCMGLLAGAAPSSHRLSRVPRTRQCCIAISPPHMTKITSSICVMELAGGRKYALATVACPSTARLAEIPASLLQQLLAAAEQNHRNISEKAHLVEAVHANFESLPLAVRADVAALAESPSKELARTDVLQALGARISRLQADEQYSVRLFQVRAAYLRDRPGSIQCHIHARVR